ncbi:hypothetical protein Ahia01_000891200 [Argonauta hians]
MSSAGLSQVDLPELEENDAELGAAEEGAEEEEAAEEEEKEDQAEKEKMEPLTEEIMSESISLLHRIGNGLKYGYVRADISNRELTNISIIKKYEHLRIIDMSSNQVTDLSPLNSLRSLLYLKAEKNQFTIVGLDKLPCLQYLVLSQNKFDKVTEGLAHPRINYLDISSTKILKLEGFSENFSSLTILKVIDNGLEYVDPEIDLPNLKILNLSQNQLKSLQWIGKLVNLQTLDISTNGITTMEGIHSGLKSLKTLEMKENTVEDIAEIFKLSCLDSLRNLNVSENPVTKQDDFRLEIIYNVPKVTTLNEMRIIKDDRLDAIEMIAEREKKKESI